MDREGTRPLAELTGYSRRALGYGRFSRMKRLYGPGMYSKKSTILIKVEMHHEMPNDDLHA